jgi:hypothetical protein
VEELDIWLSAEQMRKQRMRSGDSFRGHKQGAFDCGHMPSGVGKNEVVICAVETDRIHFHPCRPQFAIIGLTHVAERIFFRSGDKDRWCVRALDQ